MTHTRILIAAGLAALLLLAATACTPSRTAAIAEQVAQVAQQRLDDAHTMIDDLRAQRDHLMALAESVGMDAVAATIADVDQRLEHVQGLLPLLTEDAAAAVDHAARARERAESGGGWLGLLFTALSFALGSGTAAAVAGAKYARYLHLARSVVTGIDRYVTSPESTDTRELHEALRSTMTPADKAAVKSIRAQGK